MTTLQLSLALFVASNLPSAVLAAIYARSLIGALSIGAAVKLVVVAALIFLGGGANATFEEKLYSLAGVIAAGAVAGGIGFGLRRAWTSRSEIAGGALWGLASAAGIALSVIPAGGYVFAMWTDARRGNTGLFLADLLVPPFGIVRGILLWLGVL